MANVFVLVFKACASCHLIYIKLNFIIFIVKKRNILEDKIFL